MLKSGYDIKLLPDGVEIDGVLFTPDEIKEILKGFSCPNQVRVTLAVSKKRVKMDLETLMELRTHLARVPMENGGMKLCWRCRVNCVPYRNKKQYSDYERIKNLCISCLDEVYQIAGKRVRSRALMINNGVTFFAFNKDRWYRLAYRFFHFRFDDPVSYDEWFEAYEKFLHRQWSNAILPHEAVGFDFNSYEFPF